MDYIGPLVNKWDQWLVGPLVNGVWLVGPMVSGSG